MTVGAVAERYAQAIFELGIESGNLGELVQQVTDFAQTYRDNPDFAAVLDNPMVDQRQRDAVLGDVASRVGLGTLGFNAIRVLASRRKLAALPDIARMLGELSDRHAGVVRATVTTAIPLAESFYERLQSELEAAIERRVVLERRHDPSLIAGVVTRIGDHTIDGSVRGRLAQIERQLSGA